MLYAVLKNDIGQPCGVDRDGRLERERNRIELMPLSEAEATAAKFGGCVVSDARLYPADFTSESEDQQ